MHMVFMRERWRLATARRYPSLSLLLISCARYDEKILLAYETFSSNAICAADLYALSMSAAC